MNGALSLDRLAINQATVRQQWTLGQAIEGCAQHAVSALGVWRDKLHETGLRAARAQLLDAGVRVSGLCRGGMFHDAVEHGWDAMLDDNKRAIEEAATLDADCLVLVVGGLAKGDASLSDARRRTHDALVQLTPIARAAGVRLAIEPLHPMYAADRACVNTLGQALDLCDALGEGVGVAIDVYHVWWDPELEAQIARAGQRIFAYHICDWLSPTEDMLLDRGMMGDGVINLREIRTWIEQAGYRGYHEVEIFSARNWWKRDADDVLRICAQRFLHAT